MPEDTNGLPPPSNTGMTATSISSTESAASKLAKRLPPPNSQMLRPGSALRAATSHAIKYAPHREFLLMCVAGRVVYCISRLPTSSRGLLALFPGLSLRVRLLATG